MKRSIPERSAETNWLVDKLRTLAVGEIITYKDLTAVCGEDVQTRRAGLLRTARKILLREESKLFGAVINVGLKRLDDLGVLGDLTTQTRRIHNLARYGREKSVCIETPEKLTKQQFVEWRAKQSYFGLIEVSTRERKIKQLEDRLGKNEQPKELNLGEMLEALKGNST